MLLAIVSSFGLAALAPWLHPRCRGRAGWILAPLPAVAAACFLGALLNGEFGPETYAGLPLPGVELSFQADGLSLLFGALISGVGAVVAVYAGGYLRGNPGLGRFYLFFFAFMGSMLGLVLSDHLISLFIFWELTSLWSYLLIGFHSEREQARRSALQAFVVTEIGGLCLLAGLVLLARAGGSWELSELANRGELLRSRPEYPYILALILAGAFTKSAQVPFHFWLPNAMEAPTPASAYLHAATMVKAGVYLLLRLTPILGGSDAWKALLQGVGGLTLLLGAWLALRQTDLKRLLAYSTVASLGAMVLLIGVGTPLALSAAILYMVAHAFYKGALFLCVGAVDHARGERDILRLGGLARAMPWTGAAALLSALSMASLPPFLGYLGKEAFYEAVVSGAGRWLAIVAVIGNALLFSVSLWILRPFRGPPTPSPRPAHDVEISLRLGPSVLAVLGLALALFPGALAERVLGPAVQAASGLTTDVDLAFWHGWTVPLFLSAATIGLGAGFFGIRRVLASETSLAALARRWGPDRLFDRLFEALKAFALRQTRLLQSGSLPAYVTITLLAAVLLPGAALAWRVDVLRSPRPPLPPVEASVAGLILVAALSAVALRSMLAAIASMGVVGYGIALLFVFYGAPDLAMTQFVVESLTVILYVLVFRQLPRRPERARPRIRDVSAAVGIGALLCAFLFFVQASPPQGDLRDYFREASLPLAHGRNVVNVILVDFRGIDTLGEITVLVAAAAGSYALLRLLPGGKESR
jgi:multicomponent Na+:H+ antiporter subunit A